MKYAIHKAVCAKCERTKTVSDFTGVCFYCMNHSNETKEYAMRERGGDECARLRARIAELERENGNLRRMLGLTTKT